MLGAAKAFCAAVLQSDDLDGYVEFLLDAACDLGEGTVRYSIHADNGVVSLEAWSISLASESSGEDGGELFEVRVLDSATGVVVWESDNVTGGLDVEVGGSDITAEGDFRHPPTDPGRQGVGGTFHARC